MSNLEHELRCNCSKNTLLGVFKTDEEGVPFLHVKSWKQKRIFTDIEVSGGLVRVRCRDCHRVNTVHVKGS